MSVILLTYSDTKWTYFRCAVSPRVGGLRRLDENDSLSPEPCLSFLVVECFVRVGERGGVEKYYVSFNSSPADSQLRDVGTYEAQ